MRAFSVLVLALFFCCPPSATALLPSVDKLRKLNSHYFMTRRHHRSDHDDNDVGYHYSSAVTQHSPLHDRRPDIMDEKNAQQSPDDQSPLLLGNAATIRRRDLFLLAGSSTTGIITSLTRSQSANAIENPLNLKGTFWETGQLYEKPPPPDDDDDFFAILENTVEALSSPPLMDAISEGKYGQASRLLRGGLVSESKIRLAANALMDSMPEEEEDRALYKSAESFRLFLRGLDVLDAEVEAASRPSLGLGGKGLEGDPRMEILTRLGEVEDALRRFLKNVRSGLGEGK